MEIKKMKFNRILSFFLCILCMFAMTACNDENTESAEIEEEPTLEIDSNSEEIAFLEPTGLLAYDQRLFVVDRGLNAIFEINNLKNNKVDGKIIRGNNDGPIGGYSDGDGEQTLFNHPTAMVIWNGKLTISDTDNNCIRVINGDTTQTLAGMLGEGYQDGFANQARFNHPTGLAVDDQDLLYVADTDNGAIRTIDTAGNVKTLISGLDMPYGLSYFEGKLYFTCKGDNSVYVWENNQVKLLAGGKDEEGGFNDGELLEARFCCPLDILATEKGIFVSDSANSMVRMIKDNQVTTIAEYEETGDDLWPAIPNGLALIGDKLYVADEFVGVVFSIDISQFD